MFGRPPGIKHKIYKGLNLTESYAQSAIIQKTKYIYEGAQAVFSEILLGKTTVSYYSMLMYSRRVCLCLCLCFCFVCYVYVYVFVFPNKNLPGNMFRASLCCWKTKVFCWRLQKKIMKTDPQEKMKVPSKS